MLPFGVEPESLPAWLPVTLRGAGAEAAVRVPLSGTVTAAATVPAPRSTALNAAAAHTDVIVERMRVCMGPPWTQSAEQCDPGVFERLSPSTGALSGGNTLLGAGGLAQGFR